MGRQLVDGRCRVRQGLGHKFIQTQLLHPHTERLGVQQRVCNLRPIGVGRGAAIAGDKILGAFQHHADALQLRHTQFLHTACRQNAQYAFGADARYPQQFLLAGGVDLHRKKRRVPHRPGALGIQVGVKVRFLLGQQFRGVEVIIPQQPICLVEAVFP